MAVEGTQATTAQPQAGSTSGQAGSPSDTPQALKTWWAGFKNKRKKDEHREPPPPASGIFGIPLADSIKYANVAISSTDEHGKSVPYGYVPIVVAKCGVFLKDKATDVEGIFRLNGSAKRIKELQTAFDSPDRYGRGLDWTGYTVHDAANVLRRYLNNLPQPIVPLEFYERFREPLRNHFNHSGADGTVTEANKDFDHDKAITTYQQLITEIPTYNHQLLLYILDLLAVFASKSDVNLMTSANLAAIFQPGVLSHPIHDMSPEAYRLSQDVLIFLIDNQDSFLIGMSGTAADEKTVREVQRGSVTRQPSTPSKSGGLGRSASNASTPGDGKRFSGVRRNVSTSSRNSRQSSQGPSTPLSGQFGGSGVHRSLTLPSKKSPALPSARFNRGVDSPNTPLALSPAIGTPSDRPTPLSGTEAEREGGGDEAASSTLAVEGLGLSQAITSAPTPPAVDDGKDPTGSAEYATSGSNQLLIPPVRNRKVSDVLLNLTGGGVDKDGRQPNKLKKRRVPSNISASGNSSTTSLVGGEQSAGVPSMPSPLRTPDLTAIDKAYPRATSSVDSREFTPSANGTDPRTPIQISNTAPEANGSKDTATKPKTPVKLEQTTQQQSDSTLRARSASRNSIHSKSSVTDLSELDHDQTDAARAEQKEKKRRWRFSQSAKKSKSPARDQVGSNTGAEQSSSSVGSWHRSRKSASNEATSHSFEPVPSIPTTTTTITALTSKPRSRSRGKSNDKAGETAREKSVGEDKEEKQGFFDKLKKKVNQARDEKKERDAEKERAKSPQREVAQSDEKQSLSAVANESASLQPPSLIKETIPEQAETNTANAENKEAIKEARVGDGELSKEEPATNNTLSQPSSNALAAIATSTLGTAAALVPATISEQPLNKELKQAEDKQESTPTIRQPGTTAEETPLATQPISSIEHSAEQQSTSTETA